MKATFRRGRWRWLLGSLVLAGGIGFVSFSPEASGFRRDTEYRGVRTHVSAFAVVNGGNGKTINVAG
jgi:hypothetical protein